MGQAQRVEERHKIELAIGLVVGKRRTELFTEDVSYSGMFLRTESPPPLRGLVRLEVPLGQERTLRLHAMVVHVLRPDNRWGRSPGIGLRFYGIARSERQAWAEFVSRCRRAGTDAVAPTTSTSANADASAPAVSANESARYGAVLELCAESVRRLERFYEQDVARGGMFVYTDLALEPGQELLLELVHPDTQELFGLTSRVVRRAVHRGSRGLSVEFLDLTERRREELWSFVYSAVAIDVSDAVIVEDAELMAELSADTYRTRAAMPAYEARGA